MKIALTIAGSDPTGGAGLQADIKVFRFFGVHGLSVVSTVTAQNLEKVDTIFPIEKEILEKQIKILLSDLKPDALKLGILYSQWAVDSVADMVKELSLENLVIDPVTVSSSGTSLVDTGTLDSIRERLFPFSRIITPNIYEASVLTGIMIKSRDDMEKAATVLRSMGPHVVVITGGHLVETAIDVYYDGMFHYIEGGKIEGEYHGTGCAFSAAITALLALGNTPLDSVRKAKDFINNAIKNALHPMKGMGLLYL